MQRILLIMFWFFQLAHVHAKGREGGGGGSFVCRTGDTIYSAEFQDIWEAKKDGIQLITTVSLDQADEIKEWDLSYKMIERLKVVSPKFYDQVVSALDVVRAIRFIDDVKLKPRGDSGHTSEPFTCVEGETDYMPVALYEGENLTYSKKVWEKFKTLIERSSTNVHEAVYKVLRDEYGDILSDRTRKIVGRLAEVNINIAALRKWTPLSEFNPSSTKLYSAKYQELVDIFNSGDLPRTEDFNNLGNKCYSTRIDLMALEPLNLQEVVLVHEGKLESIGNGKKRKLSGRLRFSPPTHEDFTRYWTPIVGPKADSIGGFFYWQAEKARAVFNSPITDEIKNFSGTLQFQTKFIPYHVAKDKFGNVIFAMTSTIPTVNLGFPSYECIEDGRGGQCKKLREFNLLNVDKYFRPAAMIFCPKHKGE
ncbi:MAG: hypothetical protein QE271_09840 [Bacteriovoracaceae bacterium]|nr:hypothetical protein [Bacteriovoracaceae bacterium]